MIGRRVAIAIVGIALAFLLEGVGIYLVETHTETAKLASRVIWYSQTMNDKQIEQAIGQDPFEVIRRAALMEDAVVPALALVVGISIGFFERRKPGTLTTLVLMPVFLTNLWYIAFVKGRPGSEMALKPLKEFGTYGIYLA